MKVVDIELNGVHRLVPTTDSDTLNYWTSKGYKPFKVNGKPVIKEVQTENTIGHIVDAELRAAILAEESETAVKDITESVQKTYEKVVTTKE